MNIATQLQAARERGRRDGLILLARLRHNIEFSTLQRGASGAQPLGVVAALGARPAALTFPVYMPTESQAGTPDEARDGMNFAKSAGSLAAGEATLGPLPGPTTGVRTSYEAQ